MSHMNSSINIGDLLFTSILIGLIVVGILSFFLFLGTVLRNKNKRISNQTNIEQKLDKIITLLENNKRD